MDVSMEYEILLLQLGSLARKHYAAEEALREQEEKLEMTIKRMSKINASLEKLKRESLSNTIMKLIGSYKRQLNHETNEIVSAKIEFDKAYALKVAAHRRVVALEYEIEEKKHRIREVKEKLLRHNEDLENVVGEREQQLIHLQYEYVQTSEAEEACYQLLEVITDIMATLDNSETISNWDIITEIDYLLKHVAPEQLDVAEAMLLDLERKTQNLERELQDLNYIYANDYKTVTGAGPAIEKFFNVLFSDWSTKDVVEKSLVQLKRLEDNVTDLLAKISAEKRRLEKEYSDLLDNNEGL